MMEAAAGMGFVLGLAGSLHCVGMCGPLALAVGWNAPRPVAAQVLYHLGRVVTYAVLGAVAGLAGGFVSDLARYEKAGALVAGALMIVAAVFQAKPQAVPLVAIKGAAEAARKLKLAPHRRFLSGLMMGLLPCGMVYAALLAAAGAGGWMAGAAAMAGFGLATSLPLAAVGLGAGVLSPKTRQWGPRLAPVAMVLLGVLLIWRGLAPVTTATHVHHH